LLLLLLSFSWLFATLVSVTGVVIFLSLSLFDLYGVVVTVVVVVVDVAPYDERSRL
jgi:hypothetical protein